MDFPNSYPDDSEGAELREFVDNYEPNSPRSELLSPISDGGQMLQRPRRSRRGPSDRYRKERERAHSGVPTRELVRLLVNEEYEIKQTRKLLYNAFDRLDNETRRAAESEQRELTLSQRLRTMNDERLKAVQESLRLSEELSLYKVRLNDAQKEIFKAQEFVKALESQRDQAEASAARARSTARKLNEERLVSMARDEGRRLGYDEGFKRGQELGYIEGQPSGYEEGRADMIDVAEDAVARIEHEEQAPLPHNSPEDADALPHRLLSFPSPSPQVVRVPRSEPETPTGFTPAPAPIPSVPQATAPPAGPATWSMPESNQQRPRSHYSDDVSVDGYVPTVSEPGQPIFLPAPSQLRPSPMNTYTGIHHTMPADSRMPPASPHSPSLPLPADISVTDTDSTSTRFGGRTSRSGRRGISRDYGQQNAALQQRRASPESQGSTTISSFELVSHPDNSGRNSRARGLSVIPEDDRSQASPSPSRAPSQVQSDRHDAYVTPFAVPPPGIYEQESTTGSVSNYGEPISGQFGSARDSGISIRDRAHKQRMADELRYSDPTQVDEWRRNGAEETPRGPPRRRPSNLSVPSPLSPRVAQPVNDAMRPQRSRSMISQSAKSGSSRNGHRRAGSSGSSSGVGITVEPPSRPQSDSIDPGLIPPQAQDMLSPEHAHRPLTPERPPSRRDTPEVPTVPSTPMVAPPPQLGPATSLPPGFQPMGLPPGTPVPPPILPPFGSSSFSPQALPSGNSVPRQSPYSLPYANNSRDHYSNSSGHSQSYIYRDTPSRGPDSLRSPKVNGTPLQPRPPSAGGDAIPIPNPTLSRNYSSTPAPPETPRGSIPRGETPTMFANSRTPHRRSQSLNTGMTPATAAQPLPGFDETTHSRLRRPDSNASMVSNKSYKHFDPQGYLDPAYFPGESVTRNNANTGRSSRMSTASPALSYLTVPNA